MSRSVQGATLGGLSSWVAPWAVWPAGGGPVAGQSGASGVVGLRPGKRGPRGVAVSCGKRGNLVGALGPGWLGEVSCGGREGRRRVARARPRK